MLYDTTLKTLVATLQNILYSMHHNMIYFFSRARRR